MTKPVRLLNEEPLLNIASYARAGRPPDRLTPAQVEIIRRTVNRAPEVVVKVLPRSSNDLKAVGKHFDYIGRKGNLDLEADDGERLRGRVGNSLLDDWDLDIDDVRRRANLSAAGDRKPAKLVHKLMFSMPPGTPPPKVLMAVRQLAREEFYGQHRYALVLHTDEPHPHVHLVLKAVSEQGVRLNIRKATLRHWRSQFAAHLRGLGVAANATERAVRGETRSATKDGIYRASLRGESRYMLAQQEAAAAAIRLERAGRGSGAQKVERTRADVVSGWTAVANQLLRQGASEDAASVFSYLRTMPPASADHARSVSEIGGIGRGRELMTRGQAR